MIANPSEVQDEWLAAIVRGDATAFRKLYNKYHKKPYTIALRILKSPLLAEEITHEVFLKLWRTTTPFNDFDHFDAWLCTVSKNLSLNALRKVISEKKLNNYVAQHFIEDDNATEEAILLRDARNHLDAAIDRLPTQQQEVFILCHQQGLKYEEAAQKLNISVNTIKTHMKRDLFSVRDYIYL